MLVRPHTETVPDVSYLSLQRVDLCDVGYASAGGPCYPCPPGFFANTTGYFHCNVCPETKVARE